MLEKGFLGPIGDDLPSLMPLLFALLVFFSTFSFSFGVFNEENSAFDSDISVLNIARILKGTSYITGYSDFIQKCSSINIANTKYRAVITNYFTAPQNYSKPWQEGGQGYPDSPPPSSYSLGEFKNADGEQFECTNSVPGEKPVFSDMADTSIVGDLDEYFERREITVKVYPVAVEDERVVKPMHLVVVAWR